MYKLKSESGQMLGVVLIILMVVSTLVPVMIMYSQRESKWAVKQARTTMAFHLAEAGIEKGFLALSISTGNWKTVKDGGTLSDYNFDRSFTDIEGGTYAISMTSGPLADQVTVISVGRDTRAAEVRAIRAVYGNSTVANIAIMGQNGVNVSGNNMSVEWGSIVSPETITPNSETHPSLWSANDIVGLDSSSTPPNCDAPNCWWWHSYYSGIPSMPLIDFTFYKSSAQASGTAPCGKTYYTSGSHSGACSSTNGKPFYVEGNWTDFEGPVIGAIILLGSMTTPNGNLANTTISAPVPQQAWKQYCNDWDYYVDNFEPTNTMTQCPGLQSTYRSAASLTYSIDPVIVGPTYIGGDFTGPNGGGNTHMGYGVLIVRGTVNLNSNSHVKWFYSESAASNLQLTQVYLSRQLWRDEVRQWPTGLP